MESKDSQHELSSERRSEVTEMVIAVVSTRTPRKTMEVAGGESFSGEVINPRSHKRSSRARKAAADLVGVSVLPKSSM